MRNIKYCGNCNPDVHPRQVREILERLPDDLGDTMIAVNGCSRVCISRGKVKGIPGDAVIIDARDLVGEDRSRRRG